MTLLYYTNDKPHATGFPAPRRKVTGTRRNHAGWKPAVHLLRASVHNALDQVQVRKGDNVNAVGTEVLDHINQLNAASLHVLAVVTGMLARASRNSN